MAWQQDPVLVEAWKTNLFPALKAEAKKTGAIICFADESGIRSNHRAGKTWAPCGKTPMVEATGRRFGLNMISAVSTQGKFRFMIQEGTVNSEVFREFLQRLMKGATRPVILVVDVNSAHKSKLVKEYVEQQEGRLMLVYLPPYSPQLNPDEQVWSWIKSLVAKQVLMNKVELKQVVLSNLRKLQKMPHIVRSFFSHQDCQYATE